MSRHRPKAPIRRFVAFERGKTGKSSVIVRQPNLDLDAQVYMVATSGDHAIAAEDRAKPLFSSMTVHYASRKNHFVILKAVEKDQVSFCQVPVEWKEHEGTYSPYLNPDKTWRPPGFLNFHPIQEGENFHITIQFNHRVQQKNGIRAEVPHGDIPQDPNIFKDLVESEKAAFTYVTEERSFTTDPSRTNSKCILANIDDICKLMAEEIDRKEFMERTAKFNTTLLEQKSEAAPVVVPDRIQELQEEKRLLSELNLSLANELENLKNELAHAKAAAAKSVGLQAQIDTLTTEKEPRDIMIMELVRGMESVIEAAYAEGFMMSDSKRLEKIKTILPAFGPHGGNMSRKLIKNNQKAYTHSRRRIEKK